MEWPKLKNMILTLLLITNVFLFVLVLTQEMREEGQEQQARETAIAFLTDRGIWVDKEEVPTEITLIPQQITWNRLAEPQYGETLLGQVESEDLGGEIRRYFNANGELRFYSNGEFSGQFVSGFLPLEGKSEEAHGIKILQLLGVSAELRSVWEEEEDLFVLFQQMEEGIPLIGCEQLLVYRQDSLVEISQGRKVEGSYMPLLDPPITVATALLYFYTELQVLGDVCSEIVSIQDCYVLSTTLSAPALLTPAWYLVTDTGAYYLNTLTGELTRGQF